jgi:calcium/calmodulin-dependent protein kinase I
MGCINSKSAEGTALVKNSRSSDVKFDKAYKLAEELGTGAYSVVRAATRLSDGKKVAVKIVSKAKLKKVDEEALRHEVEILQSLQHDNIVRLFDVFDEPKEMLLVLEYIDGGELFDRIVAKTFYNEKEARDLVFLLLSTIEHCHSKNIVHRDLKPENLLLVSSAQDSDIKLADFGFAARVKDGEESLTMACGTPGYVAPEILNKAPHGKPSDMWSVGVIMYILLGGYPPFHDENKKKLYALIKAADFEFHEDYWSNVSDEAKDLITRLLTLDTKKRYTVQQALQHSWVTRADSELAARDLNSNLVALKRFNARKKLRAGIKAVVAINRWKNLIGGIKSDRESIEMIRASECVAPEGLAAEAPVASNQL